MRKTWLLLGLVCWFGAAGAGVPPDTTDAQAAAETRVTVDPLQQRQQIVKALLDNDFAALLGASGDESLLRGFLTDGDGETPDSVAAKIAQTPEDEDGARLVRWWTTLAGPDGVKRASAEIYPLWQQQLPQALAGAQIGLASMGQAIAEDKNLSPVERAQMLELQFALTAWLARTDFGDRQRFEAVLGHARDWILASGKSHPLELPLATPQQRLDLAARALRSAKDIGALYGFDAAAVLRSVRLEKVDADGERMTVRWSLAVLGVPLVFDEKLALLDGQWRDADFVRMMRSHNDEAPPEALEFSEPAVEEKAWTDTGCESPDA